jgi:hypothetical protein
MPEGPVPRAGDSHPPASRCTRQATRNAGTGIIPLGTAPGRPLTFVAPAERPHALAQAIIVASDDLVVLGAPVRRLGGAQGE